MNPAPLVSAPELQAMLRARADAPLCIDCSFDLSDPAAGRCAFEEEHLPGALHADLDSDLCGAKTGPDNSKGRHPLPAPAAWAATLGRWGVTPQREVVVYDRQQAMYAARAWWMLRWIGHARVRVLDGGLAAWRGIGGALESGPGAEPSLVAPYPGRADTLPTVDADMLQARLTQLTLLDARAPERYRGEVEPLDARAGHIPGARSRHFKLNLDAAGRFLPASELRRAFEALEARPEAIVHQCGSGVTACHNLLAMEIAGLPGSALYPGSWSEWSADPARPVAVG